MMSTATCHQLPRSDRNKEYIRDDDQTVRLKCACWFQVVLVSATLPHDVLEMTRKFMTDPIQILVKR